MAADGTRFPYGLAATFLLPPLSLLLRAGGRTQDRRQHSGRRARYARMAARGCVADARFGSCAFNYVSSLDDDVRSLLPAVVCLYAPLPILYYQVVLRLYARTARDATNTLRVRQNGTPAPFYSTSPVRWWRQGRLVAACGRELRTLLHAPVLPRTPQRHTAACTSLQRCDGTACAAATPAAPPTTGASTPLPCHIPRVCGTLLRRDARIHTANVATTVAVVLPYTRARTRRTLFCGDATFGLL